MTGRGASDDDEQEDHGRGSGRLLLVAALALALGAAAVLVLSDNARWLRLAVVAALWAALVGAFLAARYRKQIADREDEVADLQSVYELELEREVAARREYELEIEAETRKRVQEEAKDDLEALRGELRALRENLEALLGGEVLVERVALRAESTRMRALSDQSRLMAVGDKRIINAGPAMPVAKKAAEKPQVDRTELIERVTHDTPRKEQVRRPEPSRPEPPRREPAQPVRREAAQPVRREAAQPARREPARAVAQTRSTPPVVVRREPPKVEPTERVSRADLAARLGQGGRPAEDRSRVSEPPESEHNGQRRSRVTERTEMISRDALPPDSPVVRRTEPAGGAAARRSPVEPTGEQRVVGRTDSTGERPVSPDVRRPSTARAELTGEHRPVDVRRPAVGRAESTGEHRPVPGRSPEPVPRSADPAEPVRRSPDEDDARRSRRTAAEMTGGHRPVVGASVPVETASVAVTSSEGRRRAPEAAESGGRRRVEERWDEWDEVAEPGRRGAPEPAEPAGAHADGKSVSELLAAFGGADSPRRRRRRED